MNPKQRLEYWQVFDRFRKSREIIYTPKIARALNEQKREFIEQYKQGSNSFALNSQPLKKILQDLYYDAGVHFGHKVLVNIKNQRDAIKFYARTFQVKRRMPIGFNERMQQLIDQYYALEFWNFGESLTETTRDDLQQVLMEANKKGLGFDDTLALLKATDISRTRARLIARTETVTAANSGAHLSAKESGILVKKVWIATQDNRTRDDHYKVNTTPIDIDEPFKVGAYEMLHPGVRRQPNGLPVPPKEVCNCRCVEAFVPVRDAAGRAISN